jgi:hypothetical protein
MRRHEDDGTCEPPGHVGPSAAPVAAVPAETRRPAARPGTAPAILRLQTRAGNAAVTAMFAARSGSDAPVVVQRAAPVSAIGPDEILEEAAAPVRSAGGPDDAARERAAGPPRPAAGTGPPAQRSATAGDFANGAEPRRHDAVAIAQPAPLPDPATVVIDAPGGDRDGRSNIPPNSASPSPPPLPEVPRLDGPSAAEGHAALADAAAEVSAALEDGAQPARPEAQSPGAVTALQALAQAGHAGRSILVSGVSEAAASLQAAGQEQTATLSAVVADQQGALHLSTAVARAAVSTSASAEQTSILAAAHGEQARLTSWHQTSVAAGQRQVAAAAERTRDSGSTKARETSVAGDAAAAGAMSSLSSAAAQAAAGTGTSTGPAAEPNAEIDRKISEDAASQMARAAPQAFAGLHTHGVEAAETVRCAGERSAASLAREAGPLEQRLTATATAATGAVADTGGRAASAVGDEGVITGQHLDAAGAAGAQLLRVRQDEATGAITTATAAALRCAGRQATAALARSRTTESEAARQLASARLDEAGGQQLGAELSEQFDVAHGEVAAGARAAGADASEQLTGAGQRAAGDVAGSGRLITSTVEQGAASFVAQTPRIGSAAAQSLTRIGAGASQAGEALIGATSQHLEAAGAVVQAGLGEAVTAAATRFAQTGQQTTGRATDAVAGARNRVAEGQRRVDAQMSQGQSVQRSILGDIGDWISDQLSDLWNMIKSPSFWVGLIVTIVLFPALGPGALVVGGFAAGAVSGIEDNVRNNRPWYDPHAIIRNAAIGTLAGAAMALGVGVIIGAGLEGVAALGATMALSAIVGIGSNIVSGQRWDRGLLANLFLAWLFHRVGAARGEAAPGERPAGGADTDPAARSGDDAPPAPRMQEPIRALESGEPLRFGPEHAEALKQNAAAATSKWLAIFRTQGRVPWASIRAQMQLARWRYLPRAPEAAAIIRDALSQLPEGPERSEMQGALDRWVAGPAPVDPTPPSSEQRPAPLPVPVPPGEDRSDRR